LSRFSAAVDVGGDVVTAHVANSGRLRELLVEDAAVWLTPQPGPVRRTAWDLSLVENAGTLVSIDSRVPNALLWRALHDGLFCDGLGDPIAARREVAIGASRLDFRVSGPDGCRYIEAKSVTLVVEGCARFPDAPTLRGARHLAELTSIHGRGDSAAVIFVIQRCDADAFTPNAAADPLFAEALRQALAAGVCVQAFTCEVSLEGIGLGREVPVLVE
jgi:sugar fermentation stimulation protein A